MSGPRGMACAFQMYGGNLCVSSYRDNLNMYVAVGLEIVEAGLARCSEQHDAGSHFEVSMYNL